MSGKYQAYPEYTDSGVEWLREVPTHWFSTKIKYGYDITLGKMLQKEAGSSEHHLKPYLKAVNIQPYGVSLEQVGKMWFSPSELKSLKLVYGDVLISEGGDVGRSVIWKDELPDCYIQNAINRARPKMSRSSRFLFYWMNMLKGSEYIGILCNKATIAHYTAEKVENSPLYIPSDKEAEKIANFLDYETAKIDTLIEKQQQLIKLLKEKRQAVISHAVTKGLNPNAPMRDSGVEWLGEVPEHWGVQRLKLACRVITKKVYIERQKVIALENIESWTGKYILTDSVYAGHDVEFESGDVLFGKLRPYLAKVYYSKERGVAFGDLLVYRPREYLKSKYCFYQMINESFINTVDSSTYGSKMPRASAEFINDMEVLIPPSQEQNEIIDHIKSSLDKFDTVELKAKLAINLMQERRTALISAAVTGKIDVRHFTPEDGQAPSPSNTNNKEAAA
ncbi:restriction endonuclease subunit S [Pseudomonadales bacterium]|nr:restriction endonuclease subunit S [Pseudomonadales bacterium]